MPANSKHIYTDAGKTVIEYDGTDLSMILAIVEYNRDGNQYVERYGSDWSFAGASKTYNSEDRHVVEIYNNQWKFDSASITYADRDDRRILENYGTGWTFTGGTIAYSRGDHFVTETYDENWALTSATVTYAKEDHKFIENYGSDWNLISSSESYFSVDGEYTHHYGSNWHFTGATLISSYRPGTTDFFDTNWNLIAINHEPTDIVLSSGSIDNLTLPGEVVAMVSATDADAGDVLTYSLATDKDGNAYNNNLFKIDQNKIVLAPDAIFDAATTPTVRVNIVAKDQHGGAINKLFELPVSSRSLTLDHARVSENEGGATIGTITITGWDQPDLHLAVYATDSSGRLSMSEGRAIEDGRFIIEGATLKLAPGVSLDYEEASSIKLVIRASSENGHQLDQRVSLQVEDVNPWVGKGYGVIGDSITATDLYQQTVSHSMGTPLLLNDGIPGRWMTDALIHLNDGRALDGIDLLTIFLGTNDYGGNHTLGNYSDPVTAGTFYADTRHTIEQILSYKPGIELVMVTPTPRGDYPGQPVNPDPNSTGAFLWQYVDAIVQVAADYGVPVIDLYHNSGITMDNLAQTTFDNLHPNVLGHQLIAHQMINAFEII